MIEMCNISGYIWLIAPRPSQRSVEDMFEVKMFIRSDQISHSVVSDSLRPHESHPSPADLPDPGIEP